MKLQNKKIAIFWILFFLFLAVLVYLLKGILMPFVLGFVLAYMLNPLVLKLQKHHFSRTWGTVTVVVGLILILLSSVLVLFPILEAQVITFIVKVPSLSASLWERILPLFDLIKKYVSSEQLDYIKQTISGQASTFFANASDILIGLFSSWGAVFDIISFIIITPVVTFYLLQDWQGLTKKISGLYGYYR